MEASVTHYPAVGDRFARTEVVDWAGDKLVFEDQAHAVSPRLHASLNGDEDTYVSLDPKAARELRDDLDRWLQEVGA